MDSTETPSSSTNSRKTSELDKLVKALEGWKEFLSVAQMVFLWKKPYFAYCIAGAVTLLFLLWWYMDASIVTTFASLCFLAVTADFAIPSLGSKLLLGKAWDGERERQYEAVCKQLLSARDSLQSFWAFVRDKKASNSVAYICGVSGTLFLLGLIGYYINNTFLLYLLVLKLSLLPGLSHHGYINKFSSQILSLFSKSKQKRN